MNSAPPSPGVPSEDAILHIVAMEQASERLEGAIGGLTNTIAEAAKQTSKTSKQLLWLNIILVVLTLVLVFLTIVLVR